MDKKYLKTLDYDKVLTLLSEKALNQETKEIIQELEPYSEETEITDLLDELDQIVAMDLRNGALPVSSVSNIIPYINRAKIQSVLSMEELLDIAQLLRVSRDLINYYKDDLDNSFEESNRDKISKYFDALDDISYLEKMITDKIISPTEMKDSASKKLAEIRREKDIKNRRISERLDSIISSSTNEKYLQDKLVSIRNGRFVIPVKSEYKGKIPGAVLDRSSTGATVFVEPIAVIELNNEIRELEIEEHKEIERILKDLTLEVSFVHDVLEADYKTIIDLDFLEAKSKLALEMNANRVDLSPNNQIKLIQARHPLIDKKSVVASTIEIEPEFKSVVITGPNTGGKTVTLKTLGLLSLMIQSGLFVPVSANSTTRLFSNIFADIGDEQSIEQNLSTFSAHMKTIVSILEDVDDNSLVLFDELGAGTDPIEGAALAVSILSKLKDTNSLTVATTHYPEIKEYALNEPDVLNASVEFDVQTLRPTYKLIIGLPGRSNAFEIASRLNLPNDIIEDSRKRVSHEYKNLDQALDKAQEEMSKAIKDREETLRLKAEAQELLEKAQKESERIETRKEKILSQAMAEANHIVEQTQKQTDTIYREIQKIQRENESSIDNKKLESLRRDLKKEEKRLQNKTKQRMPKSSKKKYTIDDFKIGDSVYIKSLDREAVVSGVKKNTKTIEISSGAIHMKFKPDDLILVERKKQKQQKVNYSPVKGKFDKRLDLRGKTSDEARTLTEDFLNEAYVLGVKQVEIIHGFGTGQVRRAVQQCLKRSKQVESSRLGGPGEGGAGATIVTLK